MRRRRPTFNRIAVRGRTFGFGGSVSSSVRSEPSPSAPVNITPAFVAFGSFNTGLVGEQVNIASYGIWDDPGATLSYQWCRNGIPISGAYGTSYTFTTDDADTDISVIESAANAAGSNFCASSNSVRPLALFNIRFTATPVISAGGATYTPAWFGIAYPGAWEANPPEPSPQVGYTWWLSSGEFLSSDSTYYAEIAGEYFLKLTLTPLVGSEVSEESNRIYLNSYES